MLERQELHCHNCNQYVQFSMDMDINGNHVLECPNCGHEHCRVVKDGVITDDRWDSRNTDVPRVPVYSITYSATSSSMTYVANNNNTASSATNTLLFYDAWANVGNY